VLNLLALLLDTRRALTREEIVHDVAGYPAQITAYRRAFERDKETLRGMGVPLTTEPIGDGSELGYRVRPDDYYLPDLGLDAEEAAALRVAVSAVSLGSHAGEGALLKLGGLADEAVAPIASLPIAPALATLFEAFRTRAVVRFTHRDRLRTVEPWGLTSKRGHWYLVGFDRDRDALRAFRADRIEGDVELGEPDAFETPPDFRPDAPTPAGDPLLLYFTSGTTAKAKLNSSTRTLSSPRNRPVEIVEPERENPRKGRHSPCTAPIQAESPAPSRRDVSGQCLAERMIMMPTAARPVAIT